jgi:hypothetical protein
LPTGTSCRKDGDFGIRVAILAIPPKVSSKKNEPKISNLRILRAQIEEPASSFLFEKLVPQKMEQILKCAKIKNLTAQQLDVL